MDAYTLMTGIPLILYEGHAMRQGQQTFVDQTMLALGNELIERLSEPGADQSYMYHIGRVRGGNDVSIGLLSGNGELLSQVGSLNSLALGPGDEVMPVNNRLNMWLPGGLENPAIRFAQGRYTLRMPAQGVDGVAQILLETPALPTIRAMEAYRAVLLFMLAGVIGLARMLHRVGQQHPNARFGGDDAAQSWKLAIY